MSLNNFSSSIISRPMKKTPDNARTSISSIFRSTTRYHERGQIRRAPSSIRPQLIIPPIRRRLARLKFLRGRRRDTSLGRLARARVCLCNTRSADYAVHVWQERFLPVKTRRAQLDSLATSCSVPGNERDAGMRRVSSFNVKTPRVGPTTLTRIANLVRERVARGQNQSREQSRDTKRATRCRFARSIGRLISQQRECAFLSEFTRTLFGTRQTSVQTHSALHSLSLTPSFSLNAAARKVRFPVSRL